MSEGDFTDMFPRTRLAVVARSHTNHEDFQVGFGELFSIYKTPIYNCIRRRGFSHEDAEDLVQAYFVDLQRRDRVAEYDPNRGKFRAFIQTDLQLFINNQTRKLKPSNEPLVPDQHEARETGPFSSIDRDWAVATLSKAMEVACRECGKTKERFEVFRALAPLLDKEPTPGQYDVLAIRFQKTKESLAVDMSRLRRSFGRALERIVQSGTRGLSREDIRDEIDYLLRALQS